MKYNSDQHHRRSIRIPGYDYSQEGWYYITICTQDRIPKFGKVINDQIHLNSFGKIVEKEWKKTESMRFNVNLDEYIIMPNHIHGIIQIVENDDYRRGTMHRAPTTTEQFGKPVNNSIPTIIRSFKSTVTKQINEMRNTPGIRIWQRNFWEHIIRDDKDLNRIQIYIRNNPINWENDDLNN